MKNLFRTAAGIGTQKGFLGLGSIWGIPIRLHFSWFLIVALLTWSLATRYFPLQNMTAGTGASWAAGVLGALLVFASVLLHEVGHAALAVHENIPVRNISLLMFGGATRIGKKPPTARADLSIALSGPLASLALAGMFAGLGAVAARDSAWSALAALLVTINLLLAFSNLIPAFPLDGGRALRALLWQWTGSRFDATRWASRSGQVFALASIGLGIVLIVLGSLWAGLLLAIVGLYLLNVSRASLKQLRLQDLVAGLKVRDVVLVPCLAVPGGLPLDSLVQDRIPGEDARCFVVTEGDDQRGLITLEAAKAAISNGQDRLAASKLMVPLASASLATADDGAWDLLERMVGSETDVFPVTDHGRLLGLLTRENLWDHIRRQGQQAETHQDQR